MVMAAAADDQHLIAAVFCLGNNAIRNDCDGLGHKPVNDLLRCNSVFGQLLPGLLWVEIPTKSTIRIQWRKPYSEDAL